MPSGKPLRPAEMIAEGKGNLEWVDEEGDNKLSSIVPETSCNARGCSLFH